MNCETYPSDRTGFTAFLHSSLILSNPFTSPFQVYNLKAIYSPWKKDPSVNRMSSTYGQRSHYWLYNGPGSITHMTIWGAPRLARTQQCFLSHRIKVGYWLWGSLPAPIFSYDLTIRVWEKIPRGPGLASVSSVVGHQNGFWLFKSSSTVGWLNLHSFLKILDGH